MPINKNVIFQLEVSYIRDARGVIYRKNSYIYKKSGTMRAYLSLLTLLIILLTSCMNRQSDTRYAQILDAAAIRHEQAESLSEDSLLCEALKHYQTSAPKDSARLVQATVLTAYHYWWRNEAEKAYGLLKPMAKKNKEALYALFDLAYKDNDYETAYHYLSQMMEDESAQNFQNRQAMATLKFFLNRPDECVRMFDSLPQYIKTAADSVLYFEKALPNHADVVSHYGNQQRAIELQTQVLTHFIGKDNWYVAKAHLSLARYYILADSLNKAERHLLLTDKYADEYFNRNLAVSTYKEQLKSILEYARYKRINVMEWAHFGNVLQGNASKNRDITEAGREANWRLTEQNMQMTIQRQKEQMLFLVLSAVMLLAIVDLLLWLRNRKNKLAEKEEEIDALRKLLSESSTADDSHKDDRFFKKILLQQLGIIRIATSYPTSANLELLKKMKEITSQEVNVDSLLNWNDLYQTIDYVFEGFYTSLVRRFGTVLNEKEIQLCCLLKANFTTKEISVVTQQSVRTVYQRKSTIRQTLQMPEAEDIAAFLSEK